LLHNNLTLTIMDKHHNVPPIVWLKVTDYMHGWIQHELGSEIKIHNQRVVSVQHIPGARGILRMETEEDMLDPKPVSNVMSDKRKNCFLAGMELDEEVIERDYGMTKSDLQLFVPIECPKMCLTKNGVLRPWSLNTTFGREQTTAMRKLIRQEFWKAVEEYNSKYARRSGKEHYPAVEMIEEFCADTETPDLYVETLRREWQRRQKKKTDCLDEEKDGTPSTT